MSRTATAPLQDKKMWRKLLRVVHPDTHGDAELFVWARELEDRVVNQGLGDRPTSTRRSPAPPPPSTPRIPFDERADFDQLTRRALLMADELPEVFARLLYALRDSDPSDLNETSMERGASFKQLAFIAHRAGMSKDERVRWYEIAKDVPLAEGHAGHLIVHRNH